MSILTKVMETVVRFMPGKEPDALINHSNFVGRPINRVDGRLKVTGAATFSAEYQVDNITYAALVYSAIAKGKINEIDSSAAQQSAGVIAVITHENGPRLKDPMLVASDGSSKGSAASDLPIFQNNEIYWNGQPVAIIVATTQEQAEYASTLVKVNYYAEEPAINFNNLKSEAIAPDNVSGEPPEIKIGDAEGSINEAAYKVDNIYHTPRYNHNAIEPHASIAEWKDDGKLVVFDTSQGIYGVQRTLAGVFSMDAEDVKVIAPFVGGAFGGKGNVWSNTFLAALAAKVVGRPVKLALPRAGVFHTVGGRTLSEQRVAIGATAQGKLQGIIHSGTTATTEHNKFAEQFTFPVRHLYAADNFYIGQKFIYMNTVPNTFMRGPGEAIGTFALESAIDELAIQLKMDPVALRSLNEPDKDPTKNTEFSSRNIKLAYQRGAEKFGWKNHQPLTQRDGKWLIGQGVATAVYPYYRIPASAKVAIYADGTALIKAAAHEMGMGTATVQLQHAADRLGLPIESISFKYGDTSIPEASMAGGSNQTASVVAAIAAAADKLHKELLSIAKKNKQSLLAGLAFEDIAVKDAGLFCKNDPSKGETYASILKNAGLGYLEVEATSTAPTEMMKYSMFSYGAQFAEVRVNEETGEVRVSRWVGSFDTGKILNPKTAASQFKGGIIMGIGLALTEETLFDERNGRIMNDTLAEYHVPVNLDIPDIDVIYNDIPDQHTPLGGHGIGEISITGAAAAIANAVFNATGVRVRDLPITLDKLLAIKLPNTQ